MVVNRNVSIVARIIFFMILLLLAVVFPAQLLDVTIPVSVMVD